MTEKIDLICPKCDKHCECTYIAGFSRMTREKGTTGHSHLVTRKKTEKILGECPCGYKFKNKDLEK